jgi:hypothetical protein
MFDNNDDSLPDGMPLYISNAHIINIKICKGHILAIRDARYSKYPFVEFM